MSRPSRAGDLPVKVPPAGKGPSPFAIPFLSVARLVGAMLGWGMISACFVASPAQAKACLNGLKPALLAGDFSGSLDCRHDRLHIKRVGHLGPFTIYDYHYALHPVCKGCPIHGGQNVIIFRGNRYFGQYKPDDVRVTVRHEALIFTPLTSDGPPLGLLEPTVVKLKRGHFPARLLVNGYEIGFFR